MAGISVQSMGELLKGNPSVLVTVVAGLCVAVNVILTRLDNADNVDQQILQALALSSATQTQIIHRLDSMEDGAQKQFGLIRELRTDVNKNDKQIMILQVNDQQMWATIDDIRKYVPSSISALEARMVAVEKDVTRIEGDQNGKAK